MDEPGAPSTTSTCARAKGRASIARQRRETTAAHQKHRRPGRPRVLRQGQHRLPQDRRANAPERDDFNALLAWLRRPSWHRRVGAWHADRLIRDGGDAERLIHACHRGEHLIVETTGRRDLRPGTATGRKRLRDDATAAAYEVDHAIERIRP